MENIPFPSLPHGLSIRPARPSDESFFQRLYRSTRNDLLHFLDAEQEFIEELIGQQFQAQSAGYGSQNPNAMYFLIEKLDQPVGRLTLDFGSNEVHVMDIAFIPEVRGKGYGEGVLRALQHVAGKIFAPLSLTVHAGNSPAKHLYHKLGFQEEERQPPFERWAWYPSTGDRSRT